MITILDISIYMCCGFGLGMSFFYLGASAKTFSRFFDCDLS